MLNSGNRFLGSRTSNIQGYDEVFGSRRAGALGCRRDALTRRWTAESSTPYHGRMISLLLSAAVAQEPASLAQEGLDAYLAARLDVVERPVSTVYAKEYDGSGRFWFVTQGGKGLSATRFAEALGDAELARTHRRKRRTATVVGLSSLALGVGAAAFGGAMAQERSDLSLTAVGFGGAAIGLATGTVVLSRQVRQAHPSALYSEEEAVLRARERNAALREELLGE